MIQRTDPAGLSSDQLPAGRLICKRRRKVLAWASVKGPACRHCAAVAGVAAANCRGDGTAGAEAAPSGMGAGATLAGGGTLFKFRGGSALTSCIVSGRICCASRSGSDWLAGLKPYAASRPCDQKK